MSRTRREWFALTTGVLGTSIAAGAGAKNAAPELCLFSKPLPFLGYPELARTMKDIGIPGVDLTTRPEGHVLPENVERDLPKAHEALASEGVAISMITTGLTSINDPAARPTLHTAARLGIPFFKLGYYLYPDLSKFEEVLQRAKVDVEGLAALAGHAKVQGGFHNHSGPYVGAAMWDEWLLLRDTDPAVMGSYFDPFHAMIEGGHSGWRLGFERLAPRLKMVAIKDFYWEKRNGAWQVRMCALGEGMVRLKEFFGLLAARGFTGPVSLHVEYEIEGKTESSRRENVLAAIERDYRLFAKLIRDAFAASGTGG